MRKKIYSVFVVLFALCSSGLASPALELFDQASATLQREYFGYSSIDLPGAIGKRRGELETACRPKGEACAFEMAARVGGTHR